MTGFAINVIPPPTRGGDGVARRHAVAVGVGGYDDPQLALPFCARDAERVASALTAHGYDVVTLLDVDAAAMREALRALVARADEDDLLAVYFSGHGRLVDGRPYLLLRDTPNTEAGVARRGLGLFELLAILRSAPRWVAVFLDACHMGIGLDPEVGKSTAHGAERGGGFALLSGCTMGGITQDTLDGGIFTQTLLDGLAGAAAAPDGGVTFSALAHHVQRGVATWRSSALGRAKGASQSPVLRLEVADLVLVPPRDFVALEPGPTQKIRAAAFSSDGRRLATASEDCSVRLWDPETGRPVLSPMMHGSHVGGVAFGRGAALLASASNDGTAQIWQATGANGVTPSPTPLPVIVTAVAFSADGRYLAAATGDGVWCYELDGLGGVTAERQLVGHDGTVWAVAFAPDGTLYSGGQDQTVRSWKIRTGTSEVVARHAGPIWAVAVSPSGREVAAAGADERPGPELVNVPQIWDRATRKPVRSLVGHRAGVTAIAYASDGRIATSSYDGRALVWSRDGARVLHMLSVEAPPNSNPPEAYAAVFHPDGERLFVGFADGRGRVFRIGRGDAAPQ